MPCERLQLPLPFPHQPGYDARDFLPDASNQEALTWLGSDWPDQRLVLFGPEGCGKSHLLRMWAARTGAMLLTGPTLTGPTLAGPTLAGPTLAALNDVPEQGALVLDDADTIRDEALLFHLLNTARDHGLRLLLSGRTAPSRWPVRLPDLSSRLRAITAVEIRPASDDLLAALLMRLIADRQMAVSKTVQEWLLLRLPRSPSAILEAVARLDRASLASGSAITRTLAAAVLAEGHFDQPEADEVSITEFDHSSEAPGFL